MFYWRWITLTDEREASEAQFDSAVGSFQDSGGWTPIIWAAEHKHVQVIKALLNRGADVTVIDKVSFTLKFV